MKERSIIFCSEMVRRTLKGQKFQTRRIVRPQPPKRWEGAKPHRFSLTTDDEGIELYVTSLSAGNGDWHAKCPYGNVEGKIWVREAFTYTQDKKTIIYRADVKEDSYKWTSPLFMRRENSRLILFISHLRVEPIQDINQTDVFKEGIRNYDMKPEESAQQAFARLWDTLNAKRGFSWESNPYVWVIDFTVV